MKYLFLVVMLLATHVYSQKAVIGKAVPNFNMDLITATAMQTSNISAYKGKITILEFWATWCSPCVAAMPKLEALQRKYANQLQVITISNESEDRIRSFMQNKPFRFVHAIDTGNLLQSIFPHRTIPHTILIDANGKVIAITQAEKLTEKLIEQVIEKRKIHLPEKIDKTTMDYAADYFKKDSTTTESFEIQPGIPGAASFARVSNKGIFGNRRISMHNFTIPALYRTAFQKSFFRLVYDGVQEKDFAYDNEKNKFCVDIIIPQANKELLLQTLRDKLLNSFTVRAKLEKRKMQVIVLKRKDSIPFSLAATSIALGEITGSGRGDGFESSSATLDEFATYLEDFGILGKPVINETGITGSYKFNFSFEPEKKGSFKAAMAAMDLIYSKEEREIDVLIIYK
jgi:uncharacterized protein (TIGR03435 family)